METWGQSEDAGAFRAQSQVKQVPLMHIFLSLLSHKWTLVAFVLFPPGVGGFTVCL